MKPKKPPNRDLPQQLLLTDRIERIEREAEFRSELINSIPDAQTRRGKNVRAVLHCLIGFPHAQIGGEWHITVPLGELADRLLKDHRTVNTYLRSAAPYVEILHSNHSAKTYVIHWLALVNREPLQEQAADCTARESSKLQAADCTAVEDEWNQVDDSAGGQDQSPRGAISPLEGVKFEDGGGQNRGAFSPHTPSENLLPKALASNRLPSTCLEPSSNRRPTERAPALFPRHQRGRSRHESRERTRAVCWPLWERAVSCRNLADPDHVQTLYLVAVELEIVEDTEVNRFRVFTQAAKQVRMIRTNQAKTRCGLFVSNVAQNNWMSNQEDEETARRMIRRADMHQSSGDGRKLVDAAAAAALQGLPEEASPASTSRRENEARKEAIRLRLMEKFPELFNLPY